MCFKLVINSTIQFFPSHKAKFNVFDLPSKRRIRLFRKCFLACNLYVNRVGLGKSFRAEIVLRDLDHEEALPTDISAHYHFDFLPYQQFVPVCRLRLV